MADGFMIDLRARRICSRQIREGDALLFQHKTDIEEIDGSVTSGEWVTTGKASNYGQVFDKNPSISRRILNWIYSIYG